MRFDLCYWLPATRGASRGEPALRRRDGFGQVCGTYLGATPRAGVFNRWAEYEIALKAHDPCCHPWWSHIRHTWCVSHMECVTGGVWSHVVCVTLAIGGHMWCVVTHVGQEEKKTMI